MPSDQMTSDPEPRDPEPSDVVARARTERGELTLRRRPDGTLELRVNGVFVTDSAETSSERQLAHATLELVQPGDRLRVLVGGLGLGFTTAAVLSDARVDQAVVVELEAGLVEWHRRGVIAESPLCAPDPRLEVACADVQDVLTEAAPSSYDVVLLDVDNGPSYLVYDTNAALYAPPMLRTCHSVLRPGGVLGVWSSAYEAGLATDLRAVFGHVDHREIAVAGGSRDLAYHLFRARRQPHGRTG